MRCFLFRRLFCPAARNNFLNALGRKKVGLGQLAGRFPSQGTLVNLSVSGAGFLFAPVLLPLGAAAARFSGHVQIPAVNISLNSFYQFLRQYVRRVLVAHTAPPKIEISGRRKGFCKLSVPVYAMQQPLLHAAEAPFVIAGFPPCSFWIKNARVSTYPACTGEHASRGRKPSLFWRGRKSLPQGKQGGSGGICQVCVPKGSTKQRAVPSKRPLHWIQLRITLTENADIHTTPFCQVKPPESRQPGNLSVIILRETQNVK